MTARDSVNVRVPRELWARLQKIAAEEERTVQAVTTRLLREALAARATVER